MLLMPQIPQPLREWIWAGMGINFISAPSAQVSSGDPISSVSMPLVFFGFLIVTYICYYKINTR